MLALCYFGIRQLEQEPELAGLWVATFRDFVPGSSNLNKILLDGDLLPNHADGEPGDAVDVFAFFGFAGGAAGEVCLMFAALGVGEVGTIVLVDCETKTAFERADVVFEAVMVRSC